MDHAHSTPSRIRLCRYFLERGALCRGAAVRGHTYCRHHLNARLRLRVMARARLRTRGLRTCSLQDAAAIRETEIQARVALSAGRIDPDSAGLLTLALAMAPNLNRAIMEQERRRAYPATHPARGYKPNEINHVPVTHLNTKTCFKNTS